MSMMPRLFFCLVPTLVVAAVPAILCPPLGLVLFVAMLGLGVQVTQRRPERGEARYR